MRRRTPTVLLLLAVAGVCLLLWETVLGPGGSLAGDDDAGSILDDESFLSAGLGDDGEAGEGGPSLTGSGRPLGADGGRGTGAAGAAAGMEGPLHGGPSDASVPFVGRVLGSNGRPAADIKILLSGPGGEQTITTDADGLFEHAAPPGRYKIYFDGGDAGGLLLPSWMLDGAAREDLEFTLREPGAVEVKVQRGAEPVANVEIVLTSRDLGDALHHEGTTDLAGIARFDDLVPARYELTAQVPEGPSLRHALHAAPAKTSTVRVRVPDGVVLRGTVRAGKDGPGVVATITLHTYVRGSAGLFETVFESDPDGGFEVTAPQGTPRFFGVEAEGYASWPTPRARGGVLKSLRGLAKKGPVTRNVVLDTGAALSGVVKVAEGAPLEGITLRFAMRRGPTASATTKADGTYRILHLQPGAYELQVETPGWFPLREQPTRLAIPGGDAVTTFDVQLAGARRLDGLVVDGTGEPIGGARVWIVGGGRVVRSARGGGRLLEVFSNANGSWVIGDIPPDQNVSVRAAVGDLEAEPVAVRWERPPPSPLRLVVKGTGSIEGRVVDLDSREPVGGANLRLVPDPYDGRTPRSTRSNAKGEFSIERVLPGRWRIIPSMRGYLASEGEPLGVEAEKETSLEVRLDPGLVFAGAVVDENGAPLRYARVTARGTPDGKDKAMARSATTDVRGQFRLTGFEHGAYALTVYRRGFVTQRIGETRSSERNLRIVLKTRRR